ncbi:diguanylate cyclase (GGDEF)-like protein [Inhella inkyongensis]|uniref:diguanylate cyclase n=1 Tax=Inhella inkyongensis TaxID=392593 RepID=A0A840S242_9BURK|nr:GGDEF domain-containing protein [Inhella inkyongensis]MBB5203156.1 diguanylate cyclase (GGDEF)-like protein [Inhella inkyongensis]
MNLEPRTLTVLLSLQLLTLGLALPLLTGLRGNATMRWAQGSLWAQLGTWAVVVLVGHPLPLPALILGYGLGGLSFVLALRALQGWLGPRPGMKWAWALWLLAAPLLVLGQPYPKLQQAGLNLWLALLQGLVVLGAWAPAPKAHESSRRWRTLLALPLLPLMGLSLWRAFIGWTDPVAYPALTGSHPVAQAYLVLSGLAASFAALAFMSAWRGEAEGRLRHQAKTDSLTQLSNRRAFQQRGAEMLAVARRHREPLALYLLDVDHFKQINDIHGHISGDEALGLLARLLKQVVRPGDCVARLGGEEFAVLLARTEGQGVEAVDARLRTALGVEAERELGFALDFSAGWALLRHGDRSVEDILRRADVGLYAAKNGGRGRLCAEPSLMPAPAP